MTVLGLDIWLARIRDHVRQAVLRNPKGPRPALPAFLFAQIASVFHLEARRGADHTLKNWLGAVCLFHWGAGFGGEF